GEGWATERALGPSARGLASLPPEDLEGHFRRAVSEKSKPPRGDARDVDHSTAGEGAAIRDRDHHAAAIAEVGHPHACPEGKGAVGGRELRLVITFAARGPAPLETGVVVRGSSRLAVQGGGDRAAARGRADCGASDRQEQGRCYDPGDVSHGGHGP